MTTANTVPSAAISGCGTLICEGFPAVWNGRSGARGLGVAGVEIPERPACFPRRVICEVAKELDAQPIVVGARGLSRMQSALLGSVSGAVLAHARRPVLVVPAAEL